MTTIADLEKAALEIRKNLLELATHQVIHIGGDLSIADVMTVLWQYQMRYDPNDICNENRDRFVLSKGHASAVTSFNQAMIGCFRKEDVISEYATDGGRFSMHSCNLVNPYVEISTGSLGHGLSIACGMAAALKLKNNHESRVYVVMGDGEQSEGSVWEAVMHAVRCGLGNLVAMVDINEFSADGKITGIDMLAQKYRAFGWNVVELDGHNIPQIKAAFDALPPVDSQVPTVLMCYTVKGKGVDFMEHQQRWHAGKISTEQYEQIVSKMSGSFCGKEDAL